MTKKNISIVILVVIITTLSIYITQTSSDKLIEKARYVYGSDELFLSSYSEKHNLFTSSVKIIMVNEKDVVEYEVSRFLGIVPISDEVFDLTQK